MTPTISLIILGILFIFSFVVSICICIRYESPKIDEEAKRKTKINLSTDEMRKIENQIMRLRNEQSKDEFEYMKNALLLPYNDIKDIIVESDYDNLTPKERMRTAERISKEYNVELLSAIKRMNEILMMEKEDKDEKVEESDDC